MSALTGMLQSPANFQKPFSIFCRTTFHCANDVSNFISTISDRKRGWFTNKGPVPLKRRGTNDETNRELEGKTHSGFRPGAESWTEWHWSWLQFNILMGKPWIVSFITTTKQWCHGRCSARTEKLSFLSNITETLINYICNTYMT